MTIDRVARAVYVLLGILYLAIGAGAMVLPLGWLPDGLTANFMAGLTPSPYLRHFLQEFGTLAIAVGLVFFWLASRKAFIRSLHWPLTFYLALDSLIHWVGPDGFTSWQRGITNSIPTAVMLALGLLEWRRAPVAE